MNNFPETVLCAISKASDGNMDFRFDDEETVINNRTRFLEKYGILYEDHIAMRCNHGDTINLVTSFHAEVGARSQEEQLESEVLITQEKGLALMLFTADCQPTSFYDPVTETIALAHVSRKTLTDDLSKKVVKVLEETYGTLPENLLVSIGPSVQRETYAYPLPLEEEHDALVGFIEEKDGMAHIDLVGAHIKQLTEVDIPLANISASTEDTAGGDYFSYFKSKQEGQEDQGRMATILMLR
jgi:polyphenol oxidase